MKILSTAVLLSVCLFCQAQDLKQPGNPFFSRWTTPYETPPFNEIQTGDFLPAYEEGMKRHAAEIGIIIDDTAKPTFRNVIAAMEKSGELLTMVDNVFSALVDANTNDELQTIAKTVAPLLSKHNDDINLNPKLFGKVKQIYDQREALNLSPEEKTVLENYYKDFVRGGANLDDEAKARFRNINEQLSVLSVNFGENVMKETNAVGLILSDSNDCAGLPENVIQASAEMAKAKHCDGQWAFTLQKPSFIPFLQYSDRRDLREKLLNAYVRRGNNGNSYDNNANISKITALRLERANLLGYKTHAEYILDRNMAKQSGKVYAFLDDLWRPAIKKAREEVQEMQVIVKTEGNSFTLAPWDWAYYAEKVKKDKYALDEEMVRPYLRLENVRQGAFDVASRLYGIRFVERNDISTYHPDVKVYEVRELDGTTIGIFYSDYYPRDGKRSGAWSGSFRGQSNMEGKRVVPLVFNVGNFSKPTAGRPALMSLDEVRTLFHEFGHGLSSLLSKVRYPSARSVPRDFVELPSQIMENWAFEPEVLRAYARHYNTNEPIPEELIDKIVKSSLFNQGFMTVEYLAASYLDLDWHTLTNPAGMDVQAFEKASMAKIGLIPEIEPRYQSTNFQHIFSGGYSSGYYSYIWAAVLDADAFQAFKETSLFDQKIASSFRANILEKGGSEDVMLLYTRFRGAEPKVDALLKRRGLN